MWKTDRHTDGQTDGRRTKWCLSGALLCWRQRGKHVWAFFGLLFGFCFQEDLNFFRPAYFQTSFRWTVQWLLHAYRWVWRLPLPGHLVLPQIFFPVLSGFFPESFLVSQLFGTMRFFIIDFSCLFSLWHRVTPWQFFDVYWRIPMIVYHKQAQR